MEKILLVEDDASIVKYLSDFLHGEGFSVDAVRTQSAAISALDSGEPYDLVLLDVSLPEGNGFAVCSYVKAHFAIPVIFLTASGDEYSTVMGLDMGADDYISKPFRPRELLSRIRSVLRRTGKAQGLLHFGPLQVDTVRGVVSRDGQEIPLSALEYRLLLVFLNNPGAVLSRSKLLEEIWDVSGEFVNDNTLTVYIKRLRDKIETDPSAPQLIQTVRGLGYRAGG